MLLESLSERRVACRIYESLPEVQRRRADQQRKAQYEFYRLNARLYNKVGHEAPVLPLLPQVKGQSRRIYKCLSFLENHEPSAEQKNGLELNRNQAQPPGG